MFLGAAIEPLGLPRAAADRVRFEGPDSLPSTFPVTAFASAAIGAAALAVSELVAAVADAPPVTVDRRPPIGLALVRDVDQAGRMDAAVALGLDRRRLSRSRRLGPPPYQRAPPPDGRASRAELRRGALDRAEAVKRWSAKALETAVVEAGGCAAAMRTVAEWGAHPQGRAVFAEPLIAMEKVGAGSSGWRPTAARPLAGVKVLDLTRVLAGPVATRFLAGYGADVLRIDLPDWDEPAIEPQVTLGKRCARLDLRHPPERARFERLISEADLFVHGYRPEALGALGYGEGIRRALNPSLVDVRLDAYGWSGPWRNRRGFDSLVQMSTGIAAAGKAWRGADKPIPLPVQALDHATGYLMAAAAVRGLALRLSKGQATSAGLSLARTAALLIGTPRQGRT
jgi:hypothetical protein